MTSSTENKASFIEIFGVETGTKYFEKGWSLETAATTHFAMMNAEIEQLEMKKRSLQARKNRRDFNDETS